MLNKLLNIFSSDAKVRQSSILLLVTLGNIPLSILSSIVLTDYLGAKGFGDFSLLMSIFNLSIVIFNFGIFQGGNRLLVLNQLRERAKSYYGALLISFFLLFSFMSICLLFFGLFDANLEEKGLNKIFIYMLPFGWLFLMTKFYDSLLPADNKINQLAACRFLIVFGHLLFYVIAYCLFEDPSFGKLEIILVGYLIANLIVFIYLISVLKPNLTYLSKNIRKVYIETKNFGFNVYLGGLIGVGITHLTGLIISYYSSGNEGVGFYALAVAFSTPLKLIPNTIGTTYYKEFTTITSIPRKKVLVTLIISVCSLLLLWLIIHPFVQYFYGKEFFSVIKLTMICSIGMLFYGIADFYNRFLGAQGKGAYLRNGAFIVGIGMLSANLLLIPFYFELGAVVAFLISGLLYFMSMYFYYLKTVKETR